MRLSRRHQREAKALLAALTYTNHRNAHNQLDRIAVVYCVLWPELAKLYPMSDELFKALRDIDGQVRKTPRDHLTEGRFWNTTRVVVSIVGIIEVVFLLIWSMVLILPA